MYDFYLQWHPEISHHWQNKPPVPCILVGLKADLRDNAETLKELAKKNAEPITVEQGQKLAEKIQADCYIECSAKTQDNLKEVFDKAITVALKNKAASYTSEKEGCGCCIMQLLLVCTNTLLILFCISFTLFFHWFYHSLHK